MVEFLNANSGFASIILAALSLVSSLIAILVSISIAKQQTQVSLFEKRLEIYNYVEKCCLLIKRFPVVANRKKSKGLFYSASIFLYPLGSKEKTLSDKVSEIDSQLALNPTPEIRKSLDNQRDVLTEGFVPFCISESQVLTKYVNSSTFLFRPQTADKAMKVLSLYETFLLGAPLFEASEFEEQIKAMKALSDEIDLDALLHDMGNEVMSKHH